MQNPFPPPAVQLPPEEPQNDGLERKLSRQGINFIKVNDYDPNDTKRPFWGSVQTLRNMRERAFRFAWRAENGGPTWLVSSATKHSTYKKAKTYCASIHARLPTWEEWKAFGDNPGDERQNFYYGHEEDAYWASGDGEWAYIAQFSFFAQKLPEKPYAVKKRVANGGAFGQYTTICVIDRVS